MDMEKTKENLKLEMAKSGDDSQFKEIFTKFDASQSGALTKDQFKETITYLNEGHVGDINLDEIFATADEDKDGKLNFQEFKLAFFAMAIAEFSSE